MGKKYCKCCGAEVNDSRFCPECGTPLNDDTLTDEKPDITEPEPCDGLKIAEPDDDKPKKKIPVPEDEGYSLLVDCCRRTVATVGGDGYDELVLYQKGDDYQIHHFSRYEYMSDTIHAAYRTTKECADKVFEAIKKEKLAKYRDYKGRPLCGGENIVKFVINDEVYRITEANLPFEKHSSLGKIRSVLSSFIDENNKTDA
ncbi:MAG: zinc ribbon domain-containing protein [Erysipelotrichaceae bacterium]|nr:zinc ribbon domain-containing protein [Erysipelotrichaceae bacterium]